MNLMHGKVLSIESKLLCVQKCIYVIGACSKFVLLNHDAHHGHGIMI